MLSSLPTRSGLRTVTWVPQTGQLPDFITAGYYATKAEVPQSLSAGEGPIVSFSAPFYVD